MKLFACYAPAVPEFPGDNKSHSPPPLAATLISVERNFSKNWLLGEHCVSLTKTLNVYAKSHIYIKQHPINSTTCYKAGFGPYHFSYVDCERMT